jgi:hypothetical protein
MHVEQDDPEVVPLDLLQRRSTVGRVIDGPPFAREEDAQKVAYRVIVIDY